jgi:flagellar protein FlbD
MIAVTCRNGAHLTVDPDAIERVESGGDTTVVLDDGTRFVVGQSMDELLRIVRDSRAAAVSARRRLGGPVPRPGWMPGRPPRPAGSRGERVRD